MSDKDKNSEKEDRKNLDKGPLKDEHMNQYGKQKGDRDEKIKRRKK
ncbi:MAG: hypothetical protein WA951_11440 [Leeuwenhoekiella sp.]